MDYINDYDMNENNIIHIDGNEEELMPGLNALMARVMELYVENYMDPEYIDQFEEHEVITIDFSSLSEDEMSELIKCAVTSLELEVDSSGNEIILS